MVERSRDRIILGFVLATLAVLSIAHLEAWQQDRALRASLGTKDDPVVFIWNWIQPGMSREEVRNFVRGYERLVEVLPSPRDPGGEDRFEFSFGIRLFPSWGGSQVIKVSYDEQGRVKEKPHLETQ